MKQALMILALLPCLAFAQTREEVAKELVKQGVPHAQIVLAQARLESGNMKSAFYRKTNNLFGMKRGKRYARYSHWRESVADYKKRISSRYKGGDYYAFLRQINYASDPHYITKVRRIANG